jgi:hypothetical protein
VREFLKTALVSNLDEIHKAPVSEFWRGEKKRLLGKIIRRPNIYPYAPYSTERFPGRYFPVESTENWEMTGQMGDTVASRIEADSGAPRVVGEELELSIGADVGDMVSGADTGLPYPIEVDEKVTDMGHLGLVRLNDGQISEIMEMLLEENNKIFDTVFGRK